MGNNRAVFYFDVEVKRRELLSRLTVAALLAERGYHVFIGERATLESIRKIIPRATVVRKSVRSNSIDILKELKGSGCKIVNLEEEGVLIGSLDQYVSLNMPSNAVDIAEKHFLWGREQLKELQYLYPELADNFSMVGNPRLCLWKDKYYGYYDDLSSKIQNEFGEFVLMSSNFPMYTNKRLVNEMLAIAGFFDSSANVEMHSEKFKIVKFLYREFVKAAKAISVTGVKVIFRPHPADSIQKIMDDFAGYDNVVVRSEYDVAPWILASQAVIHNCCSTGLEAVFMKKNTIAYTPNSISLYKLNEVNQIAKVALNVDELLDCIFSPAKFVSSRIGLDGYLNTDVELNNIVNALEKVQTKSNFELSKVRISPIRYKFNKLFYNNSRKLKDALIFNKIKKREVDTLRSKFPVTDSNEITDYLLSIYNSGLLKKTINCCPVGKNIFYLHGERIK